MSKQYSQIILVDGPGLRAVAGSNGWFSEVYHGGCPTLNKHLSKGWELIQAIPNHVEGDDITVIAFLIGKPIKQKPDPDPATNLAE